MSDDIFWRVKTQCTKIFIENLLLECSIGAYAHEHEHTQPVIINCEVWIPNEEAMSDRDDLQDVLDYTRLLATIEQVALGGHIELQETLINQVANALLQFPSIVLLHLTTAKPEAYDKAEAIGLEVWRQGPAFSLLKA